MNTNVTCSNDNQAFEREKFLWAKSPLAVRGFVRSFPCRLQRNRSWVSVAWHPSVQCSAELTRREYSSAISPWKCRRASQESSKVWVTSMPLKELEPGWGVSSTPCQSQPSNGTQIFFCSKVSCQRHILLLFIDSLEGQHVLGLRSWITIQGSWVRFPSLACLHATLCKLLCCDCFVVRIRCKS